MTKYTSNEQYEKEKANFIADIERFAGIQKTLHTTCEHHEAEELVNLLKQSKWSGSGDDDNSTPVLPIPVKKDGNGKLTKDYDVRDWFAKLNEELDEVKSAATAFDLYDSTVEDVAEELQDLITVCTSYLDYLGFNVQKRIELTKQINDKNRQRGYFEEV